jgi:group I intron endonuclease
VDLSGRFHIYYNAKRLAASNMPIYKALLKYGKSKFKLVIIEYCDPKDVISREQYYLDLLNPDYNILKIARSSLGYKHSEEIRAKISGENHPFFGKPRPEETKAKISAAMMGNNNQPNSIKIEVTDIELNTKTTYNSINEAARALNFPLSGISMYFNRNQKNPYKGRYVFSTSKI